jgi:phage shock protein C
MAEIKKLYRSRSNRMVAGVAAGLAEYLSMDPTIIRVILALTVLLWGTGAAVYLVMWVIIPEEPEGQQNKSA